MGIAGPGYGNDSDDAVLIAVDHPGGLVTESFEVRGAAEFVRERVPALALHVLRRLLAAAAPE